MSWIKRLIVRALQALADAPAKQQPMAREPYDDEHERAKQRAMEILRKHERRRRGLI